MLIRREASFLLLVDLQERLLPAIEAGAGVLAASLRLLSAAERLGVARFATEHCADKIGRLVGEVRDRLSADSILPKRTFAATEDQAIRARLASAPRQAIVCGVEAHVCMLQAALGLSSMGKEVFVVADAVGSRRGRDRELALGRLAHSGVTVVSGEMVLFEWLHNADDPAFRDFLKVIR